MMLGPPTDGRTNRSQAEGRAALRPLHLIAHIDEELGGSL